MLHGLGHKDTYPRPAGVSLLQGGASYLQVHW